MGLKELLIVGAKIEIGNEYSKKTGFSPGQIITLVDGSFEYENGLYTEDVGCPAIWNEQQKEFDSIYHLFGNDLEDFADCKVVT